jgi:hypothetical protein
MRVERTETEKGSADEASRHCYARVPCPSAQTLHEKIYPLGQPRKPKNKTEREGFLEDTYTSK